MLLTTLLWPFYCLFPFSRTLWILGEVLEMILMLLKLAFKAGLYLVHVDFLQALNRLEVVFNFSEVT